MFQIQKRSVCIKKKKMKKRGKEIKGGKREGLKVLDMSRKLKKSSGGGNNPMVGLPRG